LVDEPAVFVDVGHLYGFVHQIGGDELAAVALLRLAFAAHEDYPPLLLPRLL
jgi:hypothetical protein